MQQHLQTFDFCLQTGALAIAKLKAMQMNYDLDTQYRVTIGHGIDKTTIPKEGIKTNQDLENARLLDEKCLKCKVSTDVFDVHPPKDLFDASEKIRRIEIETEWLTDFVLKVEDRIREVGHTMGWWNE